MDFSLLLPAKDAARHLPTALQSCLRAKGGPAEILLLLTEGDQETAESVRDFVSGSVRAITLPSRTRLAEKLQIGLSESKFEYVARMDADDVVLPWRWTRQVHLAKATGVDAIFSTAVVFGKQLRPIPALPQLPLTLRSDDVVSSLVFGNQLFHPTLFAKRHALLEVGGYQSSPAEDLSLWLRLASSGKTFLRDAWPTILYRYSKSSMSHTQEFRKSVFEDNEISDLRARLAKSLLPNLDELTPQISIEKFRSRYRKSFRLRLASLGLGLNS